MSEKLNTDYILRLSGLEPLVVTAESNFVNVGERTNVTGSARFKRLILEEQYDTALEVALDQVQRLLVFHDRHRFLLLLPFSEVLSASSFAASSAKRADTAELT